MRNDTYGLDNFELSYKMNRLSDRLIQDFWHQHADEIEGFVRVNSQNPNLLKRFYDALENRVVQTVLKDLGVVKYKDLMSALVRSKFWRLFNSQARSLRGDLSMRRDFNHITASRFQKWAEKADTPEDRDYLEKLAQFLDVAPDPASKAGLNDNELETGLAPGASFDAETAALQGDAVDLSTGDDPEAEKGKFDITREPASLMWNVELLRIKANSAQEAQDIVEKFVGWARNHGQPRISVGTIKRSRDDEDTGK